MAIVFSCSHCGQPIQATDQSVGWSVECPHCHQFATVPASETRPALPPASPPRSQVPRPPGPAPNPSPRHRSVYKAKVVAPTDDKTTHRTTICLAGAIVGMSMSILGAVAVPCLIPFRADPTFGNVLMVFLVIGIVMQLLALPISIGSAWGAWDAVKGLTPRDPNRPRLIIALVLGLIFALLSLLGGFCMCGIAFLWA